MIWFLVIGLIISLIMNVIVIGMLNDLTDSVRNIHMSESSALDQIIRHQRGY